MENITIAQDNRNIKKALVGAFPSYKISVKGSTGTAYGWKHINITTNIQQRYEDGLLRYKDDNGITFEIIRLKANRIIEEVGKRIGHFYSDDGYNTKMKNIILVIKGKRND